MMRRVQSPGGRATTPESPPHGFGEAEVEHREATDSIYTASLWQFLRVWILRCANSLSPLSGLVAGCHFFLCFLTQLENYWCYGSAQERTLSPIPWLVRELFHELEPVGIAVLLGVSVASAGGRPRWVSVLVFTGITALNAYIVVEQIAYKVMFQHVRLGMTDEALSVAATLKLGGSLLTEVDVYSALNLVVLVSVSLWIAMAMFPLVPFVVRLRGLLSRGGRCCSWWAHRPQCTATVVSALGCVPGSKAPSSVRPAAASPNDDLQSPKADHKLGIRADIPVGSLVMLVLYCLLAANLTALATGWHTSVEGVSDAEEHPALALFRGEAAGLVTGSDADALSARLRQGHKAGDGTVFDGRSPEPSTRDPFAIFPLRAKEEIPNPLKPGGTLTGAKLDAAYDSAGGELADFLKRSRAARGGRHPNVILFVFESVGGKQILRPDGSMRPRVTPVAAGLQRSGSVTFTNVYASFPATVRSHIIMATGGLLPTTGSVTEQLRKAYTGPTLVSQLTGQLGYAAGLFAASDLDFEGLGDLLSNQNYSAFWHYGGESAAFQKEHYLNSWGGDDSTMAELAVQWVEGLPREQPFLLHVLPDATHHPYSTEAGYKRPFKDKTDSEGTRFTHYLNSMNYVDSALGTLVDSLKAQGKWEDTVVVLTGDHGEAFGASYGDHPKNYLHKNYLFEENVRSFFMFHDPLLVNEEELAAQDEEREDEDARRDARLRGAIVSNEYNKELPFMAPWQAKGSPTPLGTARATVSHRVAQLGDVMPSVVALAGAQLEPAGTGWLHSTGPLTHFRPAQNLFDAAYQRQVVYFHKTASPLEWGLRDGVWKFIGRQAEPVAFLYNLLEDPLERHNLAGDPWYVDRVSAYHSMCQSWFVVTHCTFAFQLVDYPINSLCDSLNAAMDDTQAALKTVSNYRVPGPKAVAAGWQDEDGEFYQLEPLQTDMVSVSFNMEWVPFPVPTKVVIVWGPQSTTHTAMSSEDVEPSAPEADKAQHAKFRWGLEAGWHTTWNRFSTPDGMTPGMWELVVWLDATSPACMRAPAEPDAGAIPGALQPSPEPSPPPVPAGCFDTPLLRAAFEVVPATEDGE